MIRIVQGDSEHEIDQAEFPLALALTDTDELLVGTAAEPAPVLWLRSHGTRIYAQPDTAGYQVLHNDEPVSGPVWLTPGDRLRVGPVSLTVGGSEGALTLSGSSPGTAAVGDAPVTGPPVEAGNDSGPTGLGAAPKQPAPPARRRAFAGGWKGRWKYVAGIFVLLALGVGFVLGASPVRVDVSPSPETLSLDGTLPALPLGGRLLALPGSYTVRAGLEGYRPLNETVRVAFGETPVFRFELEKLPGRLTVTTQPVTGARIRIDGREAGTAPADGIEVDAGTRVVSVTSDRYFPAEQTIDIEGKGTQQTIEFLLKPGWGTVSVISTPAGADVRLDDRLVGVTPLTAEPLQGVYRMTLSKDGWKDATRTVSVTAGQATQVPAVRMERIDGTLALSTRPDDVTVTIDGQFRGRTPISLPLVSERTYSIKLTRPGYEDTTLPVDIKPGETHTIQAELQPEFGIVFLQTRPSGASLKIDGRPAGSASQRLRLTTRPHRIEISKAGYLDHSETVTPRRGISKRLSVQLKRRIDVLREQARSTVSTPSGHKVRLVPIDKPVRFQVGASRREAGRRSNETLYYVEITRSFLIGETEVTNAEFRRFRASHDSGPGLNDPGQPVVSVTWDDAARYLNWLSSKEGLTAAYIEDGERMRAVLPLTDGYRLPTEAEWAYAARYEAGRRSLTDPLKFPWGASMPPQRGSGNFADSSASGRVPLFIRGYSDGFASTAPVGSFAANGYGIRDLGGNVAEWCNDFYDAFVGRSAKVAQDSAGPRTGEFHVVRGSSWRHGSITELRLSYRDYSKTGRNDLGFRIARYVRTDN